MKCLTHLITGMRCTGLEIEVGISPGQGRPVDGHYQLPLLYAIYCDIITLWVQSPPPTLPMCVILSKFVTVVAGLQEGPQ